MPGLRITEPVLIKGQPSADCQRVVQRPGLHTNPTPSGAGLRNSAGKPLKDFGPALEKVTPLPWERVLEVTLRMTTPPAS